MTATWAYDEQPRSGHPLLPGATPQDTRAALLPEDPAQVTEYAEGLAEARRSLDLTALFKTLEHSRRLALLQSNSADYRRVVRRTAEQVTGEPVPEGEPLAVTRERAGL